MHPKAREGRRAGTWQRRLAPDPQGESRRVLDPVLHLVLDIELHVLGVQGASDWHVERLRQPDVEAHAVRAVAGVRHAYDLVLPGLVGRCVPIRLCE